jgi:hypothetical protein
VSSISASELAECEKKMRVTTSKPAAVQLVDPWAHACFVSTGSLRTEIPESYAVTNLSMGTVAI